MKMHCRNPGLPAAGVSLRARSPARSVILRTRHEASVVMTDSLPTGRRRGMVAAVGLSRRPWRRRYPASARASVPRPTWRPRPECLRNALAHAFAKLERQRSGRITLPSASAQAKWAAIWDDLWFTGAEHTRRLPAFWLSGWESCSGQLGIPACCAYSAGQFRPAQQTWQAVMRLQEGDC